MNEQEDFQIVITGKFIPCWICGATATDGTYGSYTTRRWPDGRLWITPHRLGCAWSEAAGDGEPPMGMAHTLYGGGN